MKSNLTFASNVYRREYQLIRQDFAFIQNCLRYDMLNRLSPRYLRDENDITLSDVQEKMLSAIRNCPNAPEKHMPFGFVRCGDTLELVCRCENSECANFTICMPNPISRQKPATTDTESETAELKYEWLGEIAAQEQVFDEPETSIFENEVADNEQIPQEFTESPPVIQGEYIELTTSEAIITAETDSHILVNAGPGTGKTYTIIRRLEHIAKTQAVENFRSVLVLCYTNAAKNEIRKRLEFGILSGELPPESRQFDIRTFDSLATAYLSSIGDEDFFKLDFNGRITRFNQKFNAEIFSAFEYVIIDEMQDLVNERAKMTLNILNSLKGGWLLCGDKCQAIYDYECNNEISSVKFYNRLERALPLDTTKYELVGNRRQSGSLAKIAEVLRKALLNLSASEVNAFFDEIIKSFSQIKFTPDLFANCDMNETTAILCRSNAEAEWISSKLWEVKIKHNLLRTATGQATLNRVIGDMFWDYREKQISRSSFIERYCVRICNVESEAYDFFDTLAVAIEDVLDKSTQRQSLDIGDMIKILKSGIGFDNSLTNNPVSHLTVSTIHKAKGREFDNVYLLCGFSPKAENTEEARIWYVGFTRAKKSFHILESLNERFGKRTVNGRCIHKGYARPKWGKSCSFCASLTIMPTDVECLSFVGGDFLQALKIQRYIAKNVNVGDKAVLVRINDVYRIFHGKEYIGSLSQAVTQDFWRAINSTDNKTNIPPLISDVFISNIITITPHQFPSGIERMFKESGVWLGIELTGFGRIDWHYRGGV